jgi:tRNA A-37 threonylcarbamoyl transferase component Bud32
VPNAFGSGSVGGRVTELTARHRDLLDGWLGTWCVVEDHSWPLQDTTVLRVRSAVGEHTVKASTTNRHIGQEIAAHRDVLPGLPALPAPRLEFADEGAGILVTGYLPGRLVLGAPQQDEPDVFAQAGEILAALQVQGAVSHDYMRLVADGTVDRLAQADGLIDDVHRERLALRLARIRPRAVRLHFTHGDYQPRNWLVHEGRVSVIDFGRGGQRSWVSDLVRMRSKDFHDRPDLEAAFMLGMGRELDDDDRDVLELETVRDAIATVVWSHGIGDGDFEEHGRVMIRRLLAEA